MAENAIVTTAPEGAIKPDNNQGAARPVNPASNKTLSVRVLADGTVVSQNDDRITGVTRVGAGTYHINVEDENGDPFAPEVYGVQATITDPNQGGIIEAAPDSTGIDVVINDADTPAPTDADFCVSFVLDLVVPPPG